jgi:hypothetical protein
VLGHGGYELPSGLAFSIDAGFMRVAASFKDRPITLQPQGLGANKGTATDKLALSGLVAGASAQIHHGESFPITAVLGAGVLLGTLSDDRAGAAVTNARIAGVPSQPYSFSVAESPSARYFYLAPEFRVGVRAAKRVEFTFGVRALILVAVTAPHWADLNPVNPASELPQNAPDPYRTGPMKFGDQSLTGGVVFAVAPSLGARVDF